MFVPTAFAIASAVKLGVELVPIHRKGIKGGLLNFTLFFRGLCFALVDLFVNPLVPAIAREGNDPAY